MITFGDKTKTGGAKRFAEFGKKLCQLITTCGTNVKLLVASLGFVNRIYPKNKKSVKSLFASKKCREPAPDRETIQT